METTLVSRNNIKNLTTASLLLAFGIILPSFTGPQLGAIVLPMHVPALLAGLLVGKKYGMMVGIMTPLLRSFLFGMPPLFPVATAMAVEMGTYALVAALIYGSSKGFSLGRLYGAIIVAMILGRVTFGLAMLTMLRGFGMGPGVYSMSIWFASVFTSSWIGIVFHLVLIPMIIVSLKHSGFLRRV